MRCNNKSTIASISVLFWLVIARVFWSFTLTSAIVSVLCALATWRISSRLVSASCLTPSMSARCFIANCIAAIWFCISWTVFLACANCICTCGGISDFSSIWDKGFMAARRSAIMSAPGKSMFLNTKSPATLNNSGFAISGIMASTACWRRVMKPGPVSITTSYSPTVTSFSTASMPSSPVWRWLMVSMLG